MEYNQTMLFTCSFLAGRAVTFCLIYVYRNSNAFRGLLELDSQVANGTFPYERVACPPQNWGLIQTASIDLLE
jgi:hypothetical protein